MPPFGYGLKLASVTGRLGRGLSLDGLRLPFSSAFQAYWWDGKKNFGDLTTEAVLDWLGAKNVVNVRRASRSRGPALVGAGSILQDLRYPSGVVWGSGFITDGLLGTSTAPLEPLEVLAYRGPHSRDIAKGLGWGTPSVFCDPGLLMSMMYSPRPKHYEVGFVPHYWHAQSVELGDGLDQVKVIDVCQSFAAVAAELSACKVVISTSLHGIVAAHSFGIPWVWAKMEPALVGDDFKFQDFMEGMQISAGSIHISREDIARGDLLRLAKDARLPEGEHVPSKQKELLSVLHACNTIAELPLMEGRLGAETPS